MKKVLAIILTLCALTAFSSCEDSTAGNKLTGLSNKSGDLSTSSDTTSTTAEVTVTTTTAMAENDNSEIIDISESMYVTYINEIYTNYEKYEGRTVRIEGMYDFQEGTKETWYYVYRTGPGCCGNDGAMCGFEFITNGTLPQTNDWIRVTGRLKSYNEAGKIYLTLADATVEVLDESQRGAEVIG